MSTRSGQPARAITLGPRRRRRRRSSALALALAVSLTPAIDVLVDTTAAPPASAHPLITAASAAQLAEQTGQPVAVDSETTETTSVVANPDGTFTSTTSVVPVRTERDGNWVPIDTDLVRNADGTVAPAASAADMAFSGGGSSTPLVSLKDDDGSVAFSWPRPLPSPTLSGPTATYADVLPGVDLRLTALPDSYSEVLVVKTATAATNPALSSLQFGVHATGVKLAVDTDGDVVGTDSTGQPTFEGSHPVMWDSTVDPTVGPRPNPNEPGAGQVTELGVTMPTADADASASATASTTMTITPPKDALTGPDVTYPVYIDPPMSPYRSNFAVVFNNGWHYFDDTSYDLKVGDCAWSDCNGIGVGRTYLDFATTAITGQATTAVVYTASVQLYETHNAGDCTAEPVDLYSSNSIGSSTTWPGPIVDFLDRESSAAGDTCSSAPAAVVSFANSNVLADVQRAATNDYSKLTFGVRAPSETNAYQWKRFSDAASGGAAAQLVVTYAFPPSAPTGLRVSNSVACSGLPVYARDDTPPVLWAQAHDNNPNPENVLLYFEVVDSNGTQVAGNPHGVAASSDAPASWTVSPDLPDGSYKYRVHASSASPDTANPFGAYSAWYAFTVDSSAPAKPSVQSYDYPENTWGDVQGSGAFTVTSTGATGFRYAFDNSSPGSLTDSTCPANYTTSSTGGTIGASAGKGVITVPTLAPGYHTLYVRAFDGAHNMSATSDRYVFYVAPAIAGEGTTQNEAEHFTASSAGNPTYVGVGSIYSNSAELSLLANQGTEAAPTKFDIGFTAPLSTTYALGAQVVTANHFGLLEFAIDGKVVQNADCVDTTSCPVRVDAYSATPSTKYVALDGRYLPAGSHTLSVLVVGKNPASANYSYAGSYGGGTDGDGHVYPPVSITYDDNGYSAGIDYFRVTPLLAGSYSTFPAAMNSDGIASDGTSSADIKGDGQHLALSEQALHAAGLGYGDAVDLQGTDVTGRAVTAHFTMPSPASNGADNVMADGQTITVSTPSTTRDIDLLAVATCGTTPSNNGTRLTNAYTDGSYDQPIVPRVPDWQTGTLAPGTAGVTLVRTLPYYDAGTDAHAVQQPVKVYLVTVPTNDPGAGVATVTLPRLGSNFTCTEPQLHVLAISYDT